MKQITLIALIILISINFCFSQKSISLSHGASSLKLEENTPTSIVFTNSIDAINFQEIKTKNGVYTRVNIEGYSPAGYIACPELPAIHKLIEVPYGSKIQINILSYEEQVIDLNTIGINIPIYPEQASLSKSEDPEKAIFQKNLRYYDGTSSFEPEAVKVELLSKMRGVQIAQLAINPFTYDAASNVLIVKNNMKVEILFNDANLSEYNKAKSKYYSPAYKNIYSKIWNYQESNTKDALSKYPIKYVIVSDPMFETALQPFIEWKTKKGFYVIEAYTNNPSVGNTQASIKNYLKNLYEAGTEEDPAPTYVLFVGDVAQIPVTNTGQHVTDLYTVEFDGGGDFIPEMYFGRFSATSVAQLTPQIEKTLMHEQYTFPNPSFLNEVVLVAGNDSNYGSSHANGQVNYGTTYYFNNEHNMNANAYLYPGSSSAAATIRGKISDGTSLAIYTAHCNESGWGDPSFTTSNIAQLQNQDKYFFSIGNCCLSNKFNFDECFGEALLRTPNKGAVVHIGGTNSTYWNEDYYWTVGVTSNINANPTYEGTTQATYDHLFHERGEDPYVTAYEMVYIGNMAVMESSSTLKKYYWEIYSVMGDPSVMPYAGIPTELEVTHAPSVTLGTNQLQILSEPNVYVAFSVNGELLDAKLTDNNGEATLSFAPLSEVTTADIVATKQFKQPYFGTCLIVPSGNDYDVMLQSIIIPENNTNIANATTQPSVKIINLGAVTLTNASISYFIDEGTPIVKDWTGSLDFMASTIVTFDETTLPAGLHTFTAIISNPNGQEDQFISNNTKTKQFLVYSGNVKLMNIEGPENMYCNETSVIPKILVKNLNGTPLTSLTCSYSINNTINYSFVWQGNIAPNATSIISFLTVEAPIGVNNIVFTISNPNEGSDLNNADNQSSKSFRVNSPGQTVRLYLKTDYYGSETTWELKDNNTAEILYSGGPYTDGASVIYNFDWCLGNGCYTFNIYDSYGDGLPGSYFYGNPGELRITNLNTNEQYFSVSSNQSFTNLSKTFCITINTIVSTDYNKNILIYPNPSNDFVKIVSPTQINNITIVNSLGQTIYTTKVDNTSIELNTSHYPIGIYFIKINTDNEEKVYRLGINR